MEKNYICDGTKYMYGKKSYIIMPVPFFDLPETLDIEGYTLLRKSSFHVSLLYVKSLVSIYEGSESNEIGSVDSQSGNIEQSILDCFCRSVKSTDIDFIKFTGEFRLAKDGERVTLVALCEVSGLKELSESFKRDLNMEIPEQPTHVTLYTLQPDIGIGLNSPEDMSSKSVRVEVVGGVSARLLKVQKQKILFVCRGNVGRSQIAEALLKKVAGDTYEVTSAGTKLSGPEQPIGDLTPAINEVIEVMKEVGVDVSKNIRTQVTKEMVDASDKVILVVDDNDPIPDYLLNNPKVIRWDVLDPKGQALDFTRNVRNQIEEFINKMVVDR